MEKRNVGHLVMSNGRVLRVPPGFRFHPTDEELVVQYLKRRVVSCPLPAPIIPDVDLARYDPWDLPGGGYGEKERYLFCFGERRRKAGNGYWKATGKEKAVMSAGGKVVGMKRVLVFYGGKPSKGWRTNWILHEYRLLSGGSPAGDQTPTKMDQWVLCRLFQKKSFSKNQKSQVNESHKNQPRTDNQVLQMESSCVTNLSNESTDEEEEHNSKISYQQKSEYY